MADEIANPSPAPTVEQTAPVVEASVETPKVETPVVAEVVAAPVVEAAPAVEPAKAPEVEVAPTVLGTDPVQPEVKVAEKPVHDKKPEAKEETKVEAKAEEKPEAEKPAEEKKEEVAEADKEPTPLPTYEPWKFPEGMTLDKERVGNVTKMFGEFEQSTKVDHVAMQEFGQKLLDMHADALKTTADTIQKSYQDAWTKQTNDWLEAFKKDPEIGGNRQHTTTEAARQFVRTFGGNEDQQAEVKALFNTTGIGNHPAVIRLLANANLVKREGKPIPAQKAAPAAVSKIARRYGGNQ